MNIHEANALLGASVTFKHLGSECPCCGTTRHLHDVIDRGPDAPVRYEPQWQCWKCAYDGQRQRYESAARKVEAGGGHG